MVAAVILLNFVSMAWGSSVNLSECRVTHKGTEYLGTMSTTETDIYCRDWSFPARKGSEIRDEAFPDGSKILAKNYCRNPNNDSDGPWCYTDEKNLPFGTCDVPLCQTSDCRVTGPGVEYAGAIQNTISGKSCTEWKGKHKVEGQRKKVSFKNRLFSDGSVANAGRKCRNPDGDVSGPWCYVERNNTDYHTKELCDIPFCDDIGNLMFSQGSKSGDYFFFSTINDSQSLNISFRLWNPESWFHGEILLFLSVYDVALEKEDIEKWTSGIEIKFTHNGSGVSPAEDCALKKTPLILSGAKWTNLEITWRSGGTQNLHVEVFQKPEAKPLFMGDIHTETTISEVENFRYFSLGGSPAFWNVPSEEEDCPVHTVTDMNFTRFWIIKKTVAEKKVEFFVRAAKHVAIVMRTTPMSDTNQVQILFKQKDTIGIYTNNDQNRSELILETNWSNVLNFWKWEYYRITIMSERLQVFWVREGITSLLMEASHENIKGATWVSFGSPRVSYWTVYCDPRGVSDPPPPTPPECVSQKEELFNGTLSITSSGRQCIPWTEKYFLPEKYQNDELFTPYGCRAACQNFCRNLDNDPKGAFCVVKDRNSETGFSMDHCYPRSCSTSDCQLAGTGNDYIGRLNITRSKRKCKMWTAVNDSLIDINNFPDPTLKDAGNFCRNPSKSAVGTWCFTTDPRVPRDVCYIKDCDKPLECTVLTSRLAAGNFLYILPSWRKNGFQFSLKAWNPDIYEGLTISLYSLDRSKQYKLVLGDNDNEKLKLYYKNDTSERVLVHKTLPHLVPAGKWKGYWLRPSLGKIELGYQGTATPYFEWSSSEKVSSFKPMFINYGTTQNNWIGVSFQCNECLTTETCSQQGYKIYPINFWLGDMFGSKLRLHLRGTGSAFITLMWTQDLKKALAIQIVSNSTSIFIIHFVGNEKQIVASFTVSSTISTNEWSEFIISFTENTLVLHKGTIELFEWMSPFPLLIYWFTVTAEDGVITWTANCPPPDIDGEPRDGNWGKWGPWSCSVTCGKGEGRIERACNDPPPNVFGEECKGSSVYKGPCNDFPCGKISPDTNSIIRQYLSSQHKSLQVDASERVVLPCNPQARSSIISEVSEINITWTHNGFPYSRTRFHMDENDSLVIPRAQEKHCGIYICMAYQDPESIPSKIVLEVISLVVIKQKPTKKIRKGRSLTLKCNGLALSYVYADLSQRWELNGVVYKDYGLGTLQTFTVDKLENVSDSHEGVWTCVIIQEDFKFVWTTNWLYLKVKSAPSFWSHLMEDVATAPLFGKLGNERNAMILFFVLIGTAVCIILLGVILLMKWLRR